MPSEPVFMALWEDFRASLSRMSKANGYWFNYGPVEEDHDVPWDAVADYAIPPISMAYAGEAGGNEIYGGEGSAQRFQRHDGIVVSVPIKDVDGYHSRMALRVRQDLHKALMATTAAQVAADGGDRARGSGGRATTYEARTSYQGNQEGGVLGVTFYVRWEHRSGDMTVNT